MLISWKYAPPKWLFPPPIIANKETCLACLTIFGVGFLLCMNEVYKKIKAKNRMEFEVWFKTTLTNNQPSNKQKRKDRIQNTICISYHRNITLDYISGSWTSPESKAFVIHSLLVLISSFIAGVWYIPIIHRLPLSIISSLASIFPHELLSRTIFPLMRVTRKSLEPYVHNSWTLHLFLLLLLLTIRW
jgi:hypothetical protein